MLTPADWASRDALMSARNIASGHSISDRRPVQIVVSEITVSGEQVSSQNIAGRAAPGTEGRSEPPSFAGEGEDGAVDGAGIVVGKVLTGVPGFVPRTEGACRRATAVAALDAGSAAGIERERFIGAVLVAGQIVQ